MAARALEELNPDPNAVRPLVDKVIAANPDAADRVLQAFASLGARAVPHAMEALKDPQRRSAGAVGAGSHWTGSGPAIPQLSDLLKSGDAATKTEVLHALAAIGPAGRQPSAIIRSPRNARSQTVHTAAYALGQIGPAAREAIPRCKSSRRRKTS